MHGTLEMTYMAVKFNFQQVLLKTLIPRMNTLKDMAIGTLSTDKIFVKSPALLCIVPAQSTHTEDRSRFKVILLPGRKVNYTIFNKSTKY